MSVGVRYIVDDVEEATRFYCEALGFEVERGPGPGFVGLRRGELALLLNEPGAGGAWAAGDSPRPGGWCRFQLVVDDLDAEVARLAGAVFRGDPVTGRGGRPGAVRGPVGQRGRAVPARVSPGM